MKPLKYILLFAVLALTACAAPAPASPQETQPPAQATSAPLETPASPAETGTSEPSPAATQTPQQQPLWIVYTGRDGNLNLLDHTSGGQRQVTSDAAGYSGSNPSLTIQYMSAQLSGDGQFVAYRRDVGKPVASGLEFTFELWVYDTLAGQSRLLSENMPVVGLAWKPLTHLLAFGLQTEPDYFSMRGQVDSSKAKGIWAINVDTGENLELVPPENGFSLVQPQWSRDGRFLAFDEVTNYEGRGNLAYYDFEAQEYLHLDKALGIYDWSPDSNSLAYDYLTYAPSGEERIHLRPRLEDKETPLSPDYPAGYAFWPRFSPQGDQIAYLAEVNDDDTEQYSLLVVPVSGGEPRLLGTFQQAIYPSWLPDGSSLILAVGSFDARQVIEVSLDGASRVLADGDAPALAQIMP
jgi:Tol biopolymer transport system component